MLAALVVLIMIAVSNYGALFFCCFATDYYGLWLQTYHRKDLACLRILVQQSVCDTGHTQERGEPRMVNAPMSSRLAVHTKSAFLHTG